MQKITIFAFGSHGDVQPYILLGMRLQQEGGYQVTLLAGNEPESFIIGYELGFIPIGFRIREMISESDAIRCPLDHRALRRGSTVLGLAARRNNVVRFASP